MIQVESCDLYVQSTFYVFFDLCVGATAPTSGFVVRDPDFWKQLVEFYKMYYILFFEKKIKITGVNLISPFKFYIGNPAQNLFIQLKIIHEIKSLNSERNNPKISGLALQKTLFFLNQRFDLIASLIISEKGVIEHRFFVHYFSIQNQKRFLFFNFLGIERCYPIGFATRAEKRKPSKPKNPEYRTRSTTREKSTKNGDPQKNRCFKDRLHFQEKTLINKSYKNSFILRYLNVISLNYKSQENSC